MNHEQKHILDDTDFFARMRHPMSYESKEVQFEQKFV